MKYALVAAGLALAIASASSAAWATSQEFDAKLRGAVTSGDVVQQRKDVNEVTRPAPPTGPTSQTIVCSPSTPDC